MADVFVCVFHFRFPCKWRPAGRKTRCIWFLSRDAGAMVSSSEEQQIRLPQHPNIPTAPLTVLADCAHLTAQFRSTPSTRTPRPVKLELLPGSYQQQNTTQPQQHRTTQDNTGQRRTTQDNAGQRRTTQDNARQRKTTQDNAMQHKTAQDSTRQHKTAQDSTRQHKTAQDSTRQHKTAQDSTRQHKTAQDSTRQHKTAQDNTRQHKTTQDNTRQYKTTQDTTRQYNTIQHNTIYNIQLTKTTYKIQHNTTPQHNTNTTQHNITFLSLVQCVVRVLYGLFRHLSLGHSGSLPQRVCAGCGAFPWEHWAPELGQVDAERSQFLAISLAPG